MVKEELSRQTSTARHCRIAETAALLSACGRITKDGSLRFQTENDAVVRKYFTLLQKTFNIDTEIAIRESSLLKKGNVYHIEITDPLQVQNVLQGTKLSVNEADRGTLFPENGLITQQNCCKRAFIRGAFLASGSISDPEKGYHFEIVCQDEAKAENLRDIIHTFQIDAKIVLRKKSYVVYVKEGAQIVDILAIMEANVALMNLMQLVKGEERWTMIDNHTWDMILGKSGRLPGTLAPEIIELAKSKGYEFVDTDPQLNYPDALDDYRKEMDENGWEYGEDDEELFELAMHDRQYRDYKSGVAKKRFEDELQHAKDASMAKSGYSEEDIKKLKRAKADPVIAPDNGQVLWEVSVEGPSIAPFIGRKYQHDEVFCYLSTPWGEYEKILTGFTGRVVEICAQQGATVRKGDVIGYILRSDIFA